VRVVESQYLKLLKVDNSIYFTVVFLYKIVFFFFFQAEDGIRDLIVTGVQTCALPIYGPVTSRPVVSAGNSARTKTSARAVPSCPPPTAHRTSRPGGKLANTWAD